jgi:hypothetical protein
MLVATSRKLLACSLLTSCTCLCTASTQPILLIISLIGLLIWIPLKVRAVDGPVSSPSGDLSNGLSQVIQLVWVRKLALTTQHADAFPQILGCIFGCCCPCACLLSCVETIFESK